MGGAIIAARYEGVCGWQARACGLCGPAGTWQAHGRQARVAGRSQIAPQRPGRPAGPQSEAITSAGKGPVPAGSQTLMTVPSSARSAATLLAALALASAAAPRVRVRVGGHGLGLGLG